MFKDITLTFVMSSAIWYHLCNLKNVKNAHGGVSLLVKSNTPQRAFFAFFKLYKWYQITQIITYVFSNYVVCSVVCPCSFSHMLPVYCRRKGKTEQSNYCCRFQGLVVSRRWRYCTNFAEKTPKRP